MVMSIWAEPPAPAMPRSPPAAARPPLSTCSRLRRRRPRTPGIKAPSCNLSTLARATQRKHQPAPPCHDRIAVRRARQQECWRKMSMVIIPPSAKRPLSTASAMILQPTGDLAREGQVVGDHPSVVAPLPVDVEVCLCGDQVAADGQELRLRLCPQLPDLLRTHPSRVWHGRRASATTRSSLSSYSTSLPASPITWSRMRWTVMFHQPPPAHRQCRQLRDRP